LEQGGSQQVIEALAWLILDKFWARSYFYDNFHELQPAKLRQSLMNMHHIETVWVEVLFLKPF